MMEIYIKERDESRQDKVTEPTLPFPSPALDSGEYLYSVCAIRTIVLIFRIYPPCLPSDVAVILTPH